jgi:hypothetical protein
MCHRNKQDYTKNLKTLCGKTLLLIMQRKKGIYFDRYTAVCLFSRQANDLKQAISRSCLRIKDSNEKGSGVRGQHLHSVCSVYSQILNPA